MKREIIEKKVVSAIADVLGCGINDISQQSEMVDDLGADSIDAVEILMTIESELDFELPDNEYFESKAKIKTVKDICDMIEKYINK